jgi:nicotinate-nucleotide pyrophosphorylase (carboxylating)
MSGIATAAHRYSEKIKHTKARVLDTRKTTPCLRVLEKKAVEMGGGTNHRYGLYDMFLIKDNHIAVAGSITAAIEACKAYRKKNNAAFAIEIEVTNFDELDEALRAKPDRIMLDNFSIDDMSKAVGIVNGACETEASGGITIDTIAQVAETGVDFISSGALTHSVKALDISLEVEVK